MYKQQAGDRSGAVDFTRPNNHSWSISSINIVAHLRDQLISSLLFRCHLITAIRSPGRWAACTPFKDTNWVEAGNFNNIVFKWWIRSDDHLWITLFRLDKLANHFYFRSSNSPNAVDETQTLASRLRFCNKYWINITCSFRWIPCHQAL